MSNRILVYLTVLVLVGIGALFALNVSQILKKGTIAQTYLKPNDTQGMAVQYKGILYTLNFDQQQALTDILNHSIHIMGLKPGKRTKPDIEKIVIYLFGPHKTIELTPVAYIDNNLVYTAPQWNPDGYLMEVSDGQLQRLLSQTYDP